MEVPVYNMQGAQVAKLNIDENTLGGEVNAALVKQAFVMYHANHRQGSARTLNRQDVEGSTRKLYKQKGTGNARHGDKKANLFKGGGHGHSKKRTREDFRLTMPKKMRRKANRNALLAKLVDSEVRVIDNLNFGEPKTKAFQAFLEAIKVDRSAIVALGTDDEKTKNTRLSARNVDGVRLIRIDQLNAYEMLNHRYVVVGRGDLESWLNGPTSQTGKAAKVSPLGREAGANNAEKSEGKDVIRGEKAREAAGKSRKPRGYKSPKAGARKSEVTK